MKIMFWNLLNLGNTKLNKGLNQAVIGANGMGNNILDFIVNVSTGQAVWQNATSQVPADVFVIVELKSGGTMKGNAGNGACLQVLPRVVQAMNALVDAQHYVYASVPPLVIGRHEVVGVVYNTRTLNNPQGSVVRNVQNNFLRPRTPFLVEFNEIATNTPLNIVGIHGPTSKPASGDFRSAVRYTNNLAKCAAIQQQGNNPKHRTYIGGDFNVDPLNSYVLGNNKKRRKILAFSALEAGRYAITLANNTLTSLRRALNNNYPQPENYLSQPYDNIPFLMPNVNPLPPVARVDVIGNAPTYAASQRATFNAARKVSDHLPMTIEW